MILGTFLTLAVTAAAAAREDSYPTGGHRHCQKDLFTPEHHARVISNYIALWGGNLKLLNKTISPALVFDIDRFPLSTNCSSGLGSVQLQINSSAGFGDFVSSARVGFATYGFDTDFWFASGNQLVLRWSLDATIGPNFTRLPT